MSDSEAYREHLYNDGCFCIYQVECGAYKFAIRKINESRETVIAMSLDCAVAWVMGERARLLSGEHDKH